LHQVGKVFLPYKHSVPALIRRCDDLPTTITHVPVAAVLVLNTPDDGRLRPKHVEWLWRNKTCTVLHQVGVSFDLYYDARKHKIRICTVDNNVHYLITVVQNSSKSSEFCTRNMDEHIRSIHHVFISLTWCK
jgi:hypothetical protein